MKKEFTSIAFKLFSILLIVLSSCLNKSQDHTCKDENLVRLSSLIRQYEELTRIDLGHLVVEEHLKSSKSNFLSKGILKITFQVDTLIDELFVSSGGMNYQGELVGGCNKGLAFEKFKKSEVLKKIQKTILELKEQNTIQPALNGDDIIKKLESSFAYFHEKYSDDDALRTTTVMVVIFDLVLYNNYLLLTETQYFETLNKCN